MFQEIMAWAQNLGRLRTDGGSRTQLRLAILQLAYFVHATAIAGSGLVALWISNFVKAASKTPRAKSASACVMQSGGLMRMVWPQSPPLPISKPISRQSSMISAHSALAG